jgi:hypothetical protein
MASCRHRSMGHYGPDWPSSGAVVAKLRSSQDNGQLGELFGVSSGLFNRTPDLGIESEGSTWKWVFVVDMNFIVLSYDSQLLYIPLDGSPRLTKT